MSTSTGARQRPAAVSKQSIGSKVGRWFGRNSIAEILQHDGRNQNVGLIIFDEKDRKLPGIGMLIEIDDILLIMRIAALADFDWQA